MSLSLHLIATIGLMFLPTKNFQTPLAQDSIQVEILTVREAEKEPEAKAEGMVTAKEFLSAKALADPRSQQAFAALKHLASDERITQLCNVEAMAQVHQWRSDFQPDSVVAYAMADTRLSGRTLEADGGALRSRHHWYNLKFRCEVTPDMNKVVAFQFALGKEIPETEWEAHSLPMGEDEPD